MDYFYSPPHNILGTTFIIEGEEFSHLVHVMRKKEGDEIRIVDGEGNAFDARIEAIKKKTAHGTIVRTYIKHNEPPVGVTLAVGVLKNPSKFDFLVEKVTELGVRRIIPLLSERTIPSHAKVDRWQKLALAAMKQSGRSYLPRIGELTRLEDIFVHEKQFDLKMIAHEKAESAQMFPRTIVRDAKSVLVIVGPEGGFSDGEVAQCMENQFHPVYFGARRLRTETAAIVAATLALICPIEDPE